MDEECLSTPSTRPCESSISRSCSTSFMAILTGAEFLSVVDELKMLPNPALNHQRILAEQIE